MWKIFTILKNNWKKSTVAGVAAGYGVYSFKNYYEITKHMRTLCQDVVKMSEKSVGGSSKRVLVVLNPVANDKKSEKSFKKYCEPLLHLAGFTVEILRTKQIGHAKTFIESMQSLPYAIVIAGGDGTSSEVVTGLLRRKEPPCPIAILPLGNNNQSAAKFLSIDSSNELLYLKGLSQALLPMLQERVLPQNVIQFDVINDMPNSEQPHLKPIFGLSRFSWGLLKDIEISKDKYWYFGSLRHYAAAFFKAFKRDNNWAFNANYVFTPPCPGCKNCYIDKNPKISYSFLGRLISKSNIEEDAVKKNIMNDNCSTEVSGTIESQQLCITCQKNKHDYYELETTAIASLEPGLNFVKNIPNVIKYNIEPTVVLRSRTIQLQPTTNTENLYSIDGEEYEARPVKISIIPNAIKVFC